MIPDLVWPSQACLNQGIDEAGHFILPPELIVEVLSPGSQNEKRDTEAKLKLYSTYGIQEYSPMLPSFSTPIVKLFSSDLFN